MDSFVLINLYSHVILYRFEKPCQEKKKSKWPTFLEVQPLNTRAFDYKATYCIM